MSGMRFPEEKVKFKSEEQEESECVRCEYLDQEDDQDFHSEARRQRRRQRRIQPMPELTSDDFKLLCPERAENFFDRGSTKLGTNIFIKTSFHPMKSQYFTYLKKLNDSDNPVVDHTYLKISDFELNEVKEKIEIQIEEIERTPRSQLLPRLAKSKFSKIEKMTEPNYWGFHGCERSHPRRMVCRAVRSPRKRPKKRDNG